MPGGWTGFYNAMQQVQGQFYHIDIDPGRELAHQEIQCLKLPIPTVFLRLIPAAIVSLVKNPKPPIFMTSSHGEVKLIHDPLQIIDPQINLRNPHPLKSIKFKLISSTQGRFDRADNTA